MFVLSKFKYIVKIDPVDLGKDFIQTLKKRINKEFANFVIVDVGLCISFYDFCKIGDSYLMAGDAASYTPVEFRYIVFQPFRGEVLQATISSCSSEGIKLSMTFFSDITISPEKLPSVSKFDETDQVWYWECRTEDEEGEEPQEPAKFYMELGKTVKFRIVDVNFQSVQPGTSSEVKVMDMTGTMTEPGLGCTAWWESNEEEGDAEMSQA